MCGWVIPKGYWGTFCKLELGNLSQTPYLLFPGAPPCPFHILQSPLLVTPYTFI